MCGSAARTDLYGGQLAIAVPTVTGTGDFGFVGFVGFRGQGFVDVSWTGRFVDRRTWHFDERGFRWRVLLR